MTGLSHYSVSCSHIHRLVFFLPAMESRHFLRSDHTETLDHEVHVRLNRPNGEASFSRTVSWTGSWSRGVRSKGSRSKHVSTNTIDMRFLTQIEVQQSLLPLISTLHSLH
jgi:hypothetical protein